MNDNRLKTHLLSVQKHISDLGDMIKKVDKNEQGILDVPSLEDFMGDRNLYDTREDELRTELRYYAEKRRKIIAGCAKRLSTESLNLIEELLLVRLIP